MDIALHKHSAHINILLNPEEDLRKELPSGVRGADAQDIAVAQVAELAKSGAPYLQIRMNAAQRCPACRIYLLLEMQAGPKVQSIW